MPFSGKSKFLVGNLWRENCSSLGAPGRILKSFFMKCAQDWDLSNGIAEF